MSALIDDDLSLFNGRADWETDPIVLPDPMGFDTIKRTLCFRGTWRELTGISGLRTGDPANSAAADLDLTGFGATTPPMYCLGPRVLENRFGFIVAEYEWKGMLEKWTPAGSSIFSTDASLHVRSINFNMASAESEWPRPVRTPGGDGEVYLKGKYPPQTDGLMEFGISAGAGLWAVTGSIPYRVRVIGRVHGLSVSGILAGERSALMRPPRVLLSLPDVFSGGQADINWSEFPDPLYTYSEDNGASDGWVCRSYTTDQDTPMGTRQLARFSAQYDYVKRVSGG
jgi:hypothetical protein